LNSGYRREADENCPLLGYYAVSSDSFLPTFRDKIGFKNRKYFGFLTHEGGKIGCPGRSLRNYHYSMRDNPEQKSSHHVCVYSKGKEFVTIFFKISKKIRRLKHNRK
jgi:hypothetical protein